MMENATTIEVEVAAILEGLIRHIFREVNRSHRRRHSSLPKPLHPDAIVRRSHRIPLHPSATLTVQQATYTIPAIEIRRCASKILPLLLVG
ncbi:hypothetical protein PIB30_056145 [Stylosanthes scabra]|uniref:Uncharacterized protein n=1 Tax=Stylosanthes scabra TaxID=79078 RepID=A0ABU6VJ17_9FABA|nr:hypothetical protein [Stylosanthes scabra]